LVNIEGSCGFAVDFKGLISKSCWTSHEISSRVPAEDPAKKPVKLTVDSKPRGSGQSRSFAFNKQTE
jgi:hypothetical protein